MVHSADFTVEQSGPYRFSPDALPSFEWDALSRDSSQRSYSDSKSQKENIMRQFANFSFGNGSNETFGNGDRKEENGDDDFLPAEIVIIVTAEEDAELQLIPDTTAIRGMFEEALGFITKIEVNIDHSDGDSCTFEVVIDESQPPDGFPMHMMGRIERPLADCPLLVSTALQRLAHRRLPDLVPKPWGVGATENHVGEVFHYALSEVYLVPGACRVDEIWNDFNHPVQRSLMEALTGAMSCLREIRLTDLGAEVQEILKDTPFCAGLPHLPLPVGGPHWGYFPDMEAFLLDKLQPHQAKFGISKKGNGSVVFEGNYPNSINNAPTDHIVEFTKADLQNLLQSCTFSHLNLEPKHILIKPTETDFGPGYELLAITNWTYAGFLPFGYEAALKDTELGRANKFSTWYELFREHSSHFLEMHPDAVESQEKLLRATVLADHGWRRSNRFHVGNCVQEKWLEREQMVRGETPLEGFVRKHDAVDVGPFTEKDDQKLEQEALRELRYI